MQTTTKRTRVQLTKHAVVRASERYQLDRDAATALVTADIAAAFTAGRVHPAKPRWARATEATHALDGQTYAWDAEHVHTYVVDVSRKASGLLRVITCLSNVAVAA
jgi:hypothetical protein